MSQDANATGDVPKPQVDAVHDAPSAGPSIHDTHHASGTPAASSDEDPKIASLQAKNAELSDHYLRAQADLQNARRRADEEITKARKFAVEAFAESLLPVTDSLEAGLAIADATSEQIREGAEATLRQLKSALERNKVIEVAPAAGSKFDPHLHQAISVVPVNQEPNTVVSVLQKGYTINDRVLRPALVTVSASA